MNRNKIHTSLLALMTMLTTLDAFGQTPDIISNLEIYSLESSERELIYSEKAHFEAPNWSPDGQSLIINQDGLLYRLSLSDKSKQQIDTGPLEKCNNDHGITVDGQWLAISNNDPIPEAREGSSRIYVMPFKGGSPRLVTELYPSYWHGWSPEGKYLIYTALRSGDYNIFQIEISGGEEVQLTNDPGLDDGPEYSPDGKYIYYNSIRSGSMEIWRMDKDGANKIQITDDAYSNWFPHPSPDNKYLVYLSYLEDQGDRHPPMKSVALRLFDLQTKTTRTLCSFTGGQGSINVPSWSPDGSKFAFVSYQSDDN